MIIRRLIYGSKDWTRYDAHLQGKKQFSLSPSSFQDIENIIASFLFQYMGNLKSLKVNICDQFIIIYIEVSILIFYLV